MQTFKKFVCSILVTVLTFVLISAVVTKPYMASEAKYYQDSRLRAELAGEIDCLMLGSSHGLAALDTGVVDAELGYNSYNISSVRMTMDSKYWMLEKELSRNPVRFVILEVAYDSLARNEDEEVAEGDQVMVSRLDDFSERAQYLFRHVTLDRWLDIYSLVFIDALTYCVDSLLGRAESKVDYAAKGFLRRETRDVTWPAADAREVYHSESVPTYYPPENLQRLDEMMALCKSYGCRVLVVVTPVSDAALWMRSDWDHFHNWMTQYCEKQQCEFYDFNLLLDRYSLFHDQTSFYDLHHMCADGATVFTGALCDVVQKVDAGEDTAKYFYRSYEEMKLDSPYMQFLPQT